MKLDPYATFIRMNVETMNYARMAAALGASTDNVRDWCLANGCARPHRWQRLSDEEKAFIRTNWRTMSDATLAARLDGRSKTSIAEFRMREGLKRTHRVNSAQPWRQGQAKRAMEAQPPKDVIDLAAEHVARHDRVPVFRIDATGHPTKRGTDWRYGTTRLTTEQLMAKATRKGFDASIYRAAA